MTKVRFTFVDVQGNPLPSMEFKLLLRRASFNVEDVGVVLPEELEVVTDLQGQVIVDLWPLKSAYRIQVADEYAEVCAPMNWSFYVPQSDAIIEAQTLFLVPPPSNVPWDEEAIGKITQAVQDTADNANSASLSAEKAAQGAASVVGDVADAKAAAIAAKTSETNAGLSKTAAAASATSAGNSATIATTKASEASQSAIQASSSASTAVQAKDSALLASTSANNAATSALASKDSAAVSASSANTSAGTATTKASEASASAAAALASKNSAATSATEALASKNSAAVSATAAKTSETNAANSASTASTAGAAAGKTAAEAVVDGKQDKNTNLTFLSALTPLANAVITYNAGGNGYVAKPVTDFVLAGQYGIGAITSPRLPGDNANAQLPAGNYHTAGSWTGSVIAGSASNNQGTLEVTPWGIATYIRQRWSSIMSAIGTYERFCVLGVWGEWIKVLHEGDSVWGTGKTLPLAVDMFNLPGTGFYYSNPGGGTLNPMSNAAGAVMHVAGSRGFQLWGGDDTLLFRGFTGGLHQPARTIYHDGNAVGSVGAGAIVEMGSSYLGEWTKFAGGLVIMRAAATTTPLILANAMTIFSVTLPTALAVNNGIESLVPTVTPTLSNDHYGALGASSSTTTASVVIRNGAVPQTFQVKLLVIGRWK